MLLIWVFRIALENGAFTILLNDIIHEALSVLNQWNFLILDFVP